MVLLVVASCKGPMAKIDALRDALVADDAAAIERATEDRPTCPDTPPVAVATGDPGPDDKGCLSEIASALGSKMGFRAPPIDQAAAATAALVLVRDKRGDRFAHADLWLATLKGARGSGADALRLATARRMAEIAPLVGRKIEDEAAARETLGAIASAIPGACPTYRMLGAGADPKKMAAELSPEHASCVHKDLSRREGPGASYGGGVFRALEGALALFRETERALRLGLSTSDEATKGRLTDKLAVIEPATQKIATKRIVSTVPNETLETLGELHAEAGVVLFKPRDAESDASAGRDADANAGARNQSGRDAK